VDGKTFINGKEIKAEAKDAETDEEKSSKALDIQDFIFKVSAIDLSGGTILKIDGKYLAEKLTVSVNGTSELSIKNIKLSTLTATCNGSSDLRIKNAEITSACVTANGSSDIRFKDSEIGEIDIVGNGTSEIKGKNTKVGKISKALSGSSEVKFKQLF